MLSLLVSIVLAAMLVQGEQPAQPAAAPQDCSKASHREFDFWVGTWDVVPNPQAVPSALQLHGTNIIAKEHDGCVIVERWEGSGFTGSSYSIYDRTRGEWHQTWVDSSGGLHQYWGGLKSGNMVLVGDAPMPAGARFAGRRTVRMTYFPMGPDKLRHLGEVCLPDGSWSVNYDLMYTRRKVKGP